MAQGLLIALEGIDGSGTTTQAGRLATHLRALGCIVHVTAEPSTGPVGVMIRKVLRGELAMDEASLALLFAADRLDHLEREIGTQIEAGAVVLSDRYLLSSLAYQAVDNPIEWVAAINSRARRPDLSILLRVSAETAATRRTMRGGRPERFDDLARQRRVAALYDDAFARTDVGGTTILSAEEDVETVERTLVAAVEQLISRRGPS